MSLFWCSLGGGGTNALNNDEFVLPHPMYFHRYRLYHWSIIHDIPKSSIVLPSIHIVFLIIQNIPTRPMYCSQYKPYRWSYTIWRTFMRLATNLLQSIECSFTLQRVRLHFLIFELEDCSDCVCDSVDIADVDGRTMPVMSSFCGSTVPNDIFTVNNRVLVNFRTDGFTSHYGFRIYYSTIIPVQGNANCRIYIVSK